MKSNIHECNDQTNSSILFRRVWPIILIFSILLLSQTPICADKGVNTLNDKGAESEAEHQNPSTMATIHKKTLKTVTTKFGDRYLISEGSLIVGPDRKQVSIEMMPVPCYAEIFYRNEKGKLLVDRIRIIQIDDNASWKWKAEEPQ